MKAWVRTAAGMAALLLAGCGGGSGGGNGGQSPPPNVPPANAAPTFTSPASASVAEFSTGVFYTAAASDPNNDPLTYSITGGADAARFSISAAGALQFVAPPASAAPEDADANNVYQVVLQASDGRLATTLALAVTVTAAVDDIAVRRIATGFADPVAISPIAGTRELLVIERDGDVFRIDGGSAARTDLGNIFSGQLADTSGWRVMAIAAAPDFATSGSVLAMIQTLSGGLLIEEFVRNVTLWGSNFTTGIGASGLTYSDENTGWIGYAPDGSGYAVISDGSGGGAQDPASIAGKLLRIGRNPDPYAGASPVFFLRTIIGSGLHQPGGGAFSGSGELIFADRGLTARDEVNRIALPATGVNFGWPFKEGTQTATAGGPAGMTDPALEYARGSGPRAGSGVVGGQVYQGAVPSLAGRYVFGDRSGAIWSVPLDRLRGSTPATAGSLEVRTGQFVPDAGAIDRPVAFVSDATGVLYILDGDGELFRVDRT